MIWIYLTIVFLLSSLRRKHVYKTYKKPSSQKTFVGNKKPQWVKDKIIYFKAMMPKVSGYKIADKSSCGTLRTFNRQFQHEEIVRVKIWVLSRFCAELLKSKWFL